MINVLRNSEIYLNVNRLGLTIWDLKDPGQGFVRFTQDDGYWNNTYWRSQFLNAFRARIFNVHAYFGTYNVNFRSGVYKIRCTPSGMINITTKDIYAL